MPEQRFRSILADSGRGGGRWVELPFDPKEVFGQARAPVVGSVNGTPFRTRVAVYGGKAYLGFNKEIRDAAGIDVGDPVEIVVDVDDAPREVELPPALADALARDAEAARAYEGLSFTHRKEYARWIAEAKREETRERRVAKALEMLRGGVKTPG